MSRDHDRIDALLERYRAETGAPEAARELLEAFWSALEKHVEWEELVIFPAFEDKTGSEGAVSTETMRLQHREFRRRIEDLRTCSLADGQSKHNLEDVLVESLTDHNHAEENFIYPWIDSVLEPGEQEAILQVLQGTGRECRQLAHKAPHEGI